MRIFRKTPGVTVALRPATEEDLLQMELKHPDEGLLPTLTASASWVMSVGSRQEPVGLVEYFVNRQTLTITGHWVAPPHRGNGYGTIMLDLVKSIEAPNVIRILATPETEGYYLDKGFKADQEMRVLLKDFMAFDDCQTRTDPVLADDRHPPFHRERPSLRLVHQDRDGTRRV